MSAIKNYLLERQNALTEDEEAWLEGGPPPDADAVRLAEAQKLHYDMQYLMDTVPTYF
jgi:hypothetical protein